MSAGGGSGGGGGQEEESSFFFLFYYYLCGQIGQYKRRYIDELEDLIENTRPEPAHINMELGP
jgi:hypothetical protein